MNENEKIKLVKLFSGDLIIGSVEEPDNKTMMEFNVNLYNPRQVAIVPTMNGTMRVALGSVCEPFNVKRLKEFISIPKSQVMLVLEENELDNELVNGYKSEVAGIKIASLSDAKTLNDASSANDFRI